MTLTQNSDAATKHIAGILVKVEAVLEDVFAYYKFGRHENASPEKLYFLLSHCSHLLFLLWRTEQDSGGTIFQKTQRPAAFQTDLDFGILHYAGNTRQMLGADSMEEHLKNHPQWFRFWLKLLDRLISSGSAAHHEFSQHVLSQVEEHSFLDAETRRKSRRELVDLMKTDTAGHLLLRSVSVLEDLVCDLTAHFARLDSRHHIVEQVLSLICLLGQIRQIIICEMPARGPCALQDGRSWAMPLSFRWLHPGGTPGILKVILKREGGSVLCTYDWMSDSARRSQSWTVKTSALSGSYEESLFKTWPCAVNDLRREGARPFDGGPSWVLQSVEAHHLELLSHYADALLDTLRENPLCSGLVEAVAGIVRDNHARWKPMKLPWVRIHQLDQLLGQLKSLSREASIAGADGAADRLVSQIWPGRRQATDMVNPHVSNRHREEPPRAVRIAPQETADAVVHGTMSLSLVAKTADRSEPTPSADAAVPSGLPAQTASNQSVPPDPMIQPHREVERTRAPQEKREEAPAPACRIDESQACSTVSPPPAIAEEHRSDPSQEHPREESTGEASPIVICGDHVLVQELLQHHQCLRGPAVYTPISLAQLQQRLQWSRARVQGAMTHVFGGKPFHAYREKCKDHTISTFLRGFAVSDGGRIARGRSLGLCQRVT